MRASIFLSAFVTLVVVGACAGAASLTADVKDASGHAAANAIVSLEPSPNSVSTSHLPVQTIIDQRHETFLPLVVIVRKGGHVVFTNNDTTRHQVYSFSAIKQFQFVVGQGETSQPVEFPQAGIAAIGCNIHDQMIAYVFVGQSPYAAVTDENGRATIPDVSPGHYRIAIWHPQMGVNPAPARAEIDVKDDSPHVSESLPFTIATMRGTKHMHMDY